MRSTRQSTSKSLSSLLLLLLTLLSITVVARAADEADEVDGDEYEVTARVVRISLINGEVSVKRSDSNAWEQARLNAPLVEGDTVSTDARARVEIQIDARNFLRLGANSTLRIVTLRDDGIALSLVEGLASLRLAKFDRDKEYFEIDAPKATMSAEQKGLYRIDVYARRPRSSERTRWRPGAHLFRDFRLRFARRTHRRVDLRRGECGRLGIHRGQRRRPVGFMG